METLIGLLLWFSGLYLSRALKQGESDKLLLKPLSSLHWRQKLGGQISQENGCVSGVEVLSLLTKSFVTAPSHPAEPVPPQKVEAGSAYPSVLC